MSDSLNFDDAIRAGQVDGLERTTLPPVATVDHVVAILRRYRYPISTEAALQTAVENVLRAAALRFEREVVFGPANRLDFYLPDLQLALELKIDGSAAEVTRQLFRYAQDDRVAVIVLMTSRYAHARVPHAMNGKVIEVITLWEGAL